MGDGCKNWSFPNPSGSMTLKDPHTAAWDKQLICDGMPGGADSVLNTYEDFYLTGGKLQIKMMQNLESTQIFYLNSDKVTISLLATSSLVDYNRGKKIIVTRST